MKIYNTKYALSQGILEQEADECSSPKMVRVCQSDGYAQYLHGQDWHMTKEAAVARAEDMRQRKIEQLRKKLVELEEMRFDHAAG